MLILTCINNLSIPNGHSCMMDRIQQHISALYAFACCQINTARHILKSRCKKDIVHRSCSWCVSWSRFIF